MDLSKQIYYCETCGVRVDAKDLAESPAPEQAAAVKCQKCRERALPAQPGKNRSSAMRITPAGSDSPRGAPAGAAGGPRVTRPAATPLKGPANAGGLPAGQILATLGLIALGACMVLFYSNGNSRPQNPSTSETKAATIPASQASNATAEKTQAAPREELRPKVPEAPVIQPKSEEEQAQDALAEVQRFENLANGDESGSIARLDAFAARYPATLAAARARTMADALKKNLASKASPKAPADLHVSKSEKEIPAPKPSETATAGSSLFKASYEDEKSPGMIFGEIAPNPPEGANGKAMKLSPVAKRNGEIRGGAGYFGYPREAPQRDKHAFATLPEKAIIRFRFHAENAAKLRVVLVSKNETGTWHYYLEPVTNGAWTSVEIALGDWKRKSEGPAPAGGMELAELYVTIYGKDSVIGYIDDLEIAAPKP